MAAWQEAVPKQDLPAPPHAWDPRLLWATLALVVIILVGAVLLEWLRRWRNRSELRPFDANDQLAHFRELYEEGELSEREFERIRTRLSGELRKELDLPAAGPAGPTSLQPGPPEQEPPPAAPEQTGNPPA